MKKNLKIGDPIPSFTITDQNGESFSNKDLLGKNHVVFFYPKDDSPVCTVQACSFRDAYEDFLQYNCEIIGISSDDETSHDKFKSKHELPYKLITDNNGILRKAFGVPTNLLGLLPGRVTYVIDAKGMIQYIFNSQLNGNKHITSTLDFLKQHETIHSNQ